MKLLKQKLAHDESGEGTIRTLLLITMSLFTKNKAQVWIAITSANNLNESVCFICISD